MASTNFDKMPRKLWEHPDRKSTIMWRFMQDANKKLNLNLQVSKILKPISYCYRSISRKCMYLRTHFVDRDISTRYAHTYIYLSTSIILIPRE
jgi:hypothetical protein